MNELILNLQTMLSTGYDVVDLMKSSDRKPVILINTPFVDLMGDTINVYLIGHDPNFNQFHYDDGGYVINELKLYHDHDQKYQTVIDQIEHSQDFYDVRIHHDHLISTPHQGSEILDHGHFHSYLQALLDAVQTLSLALR